MKKILRGLGRLVVLLLVSVTVGSLTLPAQAHAKVECEEIEATLTSTFTGPFSTVGTIDGDLEGTTSFAGDPSAQAQIFGTASPPLEPFTFSYAGDLTIVTEEGTLTTRGIGVFEAVAMGAGTSFDKVIAGTGKFQGATGLLYFNFIATSDFTGFTSDVSGVICIIDHD